MLPDRVSNPGPLTYESGALPIALRGPAAEVMIIGCDRYTEVPVTVEIETKRWVFVFFGVKFIITREFFENQRVLFDPNWWVSFAPEFQCCYFYESSCLFYLSFNSDFYVSKIMLLLARNLPRNPNN